MSVKFMIPADAKQETAGSLSSLTTTEKGSLVGAVNEVNSKIAPMNDFKAGPQANYGTDLSPSNGCFISDIPYNYIGRIRLNATDSPTSASLLGNCISTGTSSHRTLIFQSSANDVYVCYDNNTNWHRISYVDNSSSTTATRNTSSTSDGGLTIIKQSGLLFLTGNMQCKAVNQALGTLYYTAPTGYRPSSSVRLNAFSVNVEEDSDKMVINLIFDTDGKLKKQASGKTENSASWYVISGVAPCAV